MWLNNTTATQATYYGQSGHSYAFFSVATDSSGDVQTAPAASDTLVTIVLPGVTIGLYNPTASTFYLRDSNTTGFANSAFAYGPANSNLITIIGDWTGDGVDTIGLYNPTTSMFFLSDSNVGGFADNVFVFGPANGGMVPIVGDWDGNGTDTVGLYNPTTSMFFLKNSNSTGFADLAFAYGPGGSGWTPLAGDWNDQGKDTIGLYNPATSMFYLRNSNTTGFSDTAFVYGPAQSGWKPLVGDWNGDGTDTVGLYNPTASMFYLRNCNTTGFSDLAFAYGPANAGWIPLIGNWTGSGQAEMAAAQVTAAQNVPTLAQTDLQPIVNEAIALWSQAGLNAATVQKLAAGPICDQRSAGRLSRSNTGERHLSRHQRGRQRLVHRPDAGQQRRVFRLGGELAVAGRGPAGFGSDRPADRGGTRTRAYCRLGRYGAWRAT